MRIPSRADSLVSASAAAAALLGLACGASQEETEAAWPEHPHRPDLVVVTVDTARADRFGYAGSSPVPTPQVDALAAEGTTFLQAVTSVPVTLPSHASLFTGRLPPRHGVRSNGTFRLPEEAVTLAEILHEAGYRTAAFIGSEVLSARYGLAQGFDLYDDAMGPKTDGGFFAYRERRAETVVAGALTWIAKQGDQPCFAWLHLWDPHAPYDAPEPERSRRDLAPYDREIAYVDRQLGGLIRGLRRAGRWEETVFAFTADHGEGLGEHAEPTHGVLLHDATLRVPLLIRAPGARRGGRVDQQVRLVDLLPTLLGLLHLPAPSDIDGRDLSGLVRGEPVPGPAPPAYIETWLPFLVHGWARLQGVRTDSWKLIEGAALELYDLRADAGETSNLAPSKPAVVEALRVELDRLRREPERPPDAALEPDAPTRSALEALGYLGSGGPTGKRPAAAPPDPRERLRSLGARMARAERLQNARHFPEALEAYREVLADDPTNARVAARVARLLRYLGRAEEAERGFARALQLAPHDEGLWIEHARALLQGERFSEARASLKTAARRFPRSVELHLAWAEACARSGAMACAEKALVRAAELVALDPDVGRAGPGPEEAIGGRRARLAEDAARVGSWCWEAGAVAPAVRAYRITARMVPNDPRVRFNLGLALERAGRRDLARSEYDRALDLDPALEEARIRRKALGEAARTGAAPGSGRRP